MRFHNFLNEASEQADTKNTNISFSFRTDASKESLEKSITDSDIDKSITYNIQNIGNTTTFTIDPMIPCNPDNIKYLAELLKEFSNNKVVLQEAKLFLQNKSMTDYNIAWFYFQFCLNLASKGTADKVIKKLVDNKEQFPFNIFKNLHIHNKLLQSIKKLDTQKNINNIIALLKDQNQFLISPVKDQSGIPIISLTITGGLKELRNLIYPVSKIKNLLIIFNATQNIDSSDAFESMDEFKRAYDGQLDKKENIDKRENGSEEPYKRELEKQVGNITYKINEKTKHEFLQKYPWMDSPNATGEVSIETSIPHRPFTFTGEWNDGEWNGDEHLIFENSTFENGSFNGGYFFNSTWNDGNFTNGKIFRSKFNGGSFSNGRFIKSIFNDGAFSTGVFEDSKWKDGRWESGTWKSGSIWSEKYRVWIPSVIDPNNFRKVERESWTMQKLVNTAKGVK